VIRAVALLLAGSGLLAGCASQTALLLPGEAGHPVGALVVLNKDGSDATVLDEANEALGSGKGVRRNVKSKPAYTELMAGLPMPAQPFTLTYANGESVPKQNAENLRTIDYIKDVAATRPGAEVQVTGHTDDNDDNGRFDNIKLSRERAENFRAVLIASGIPADQVSAVGRGALEPADSNDPKNDDKNRRIVVIIR
jgi:OOP family OmpA-OmpF porin